MIRTARALVGYMTVESAIPLIHGSVPETEADTTAARAIWEAAKAEVASMLHPTLVEPLAEAPDAIRPLLDQVLTRGDVQQTFATHDWSVGWIDLTRSVLTRRLSIQTMPWRV